jgi:hypothetical protein
VPSPTPTVPPTLSPAALREAAVERVQREGYTARDPQTYDARAQLRVLVGARIGASNDYRVFFFLGERYLGTDTLEPSAAPLSAVQQDSSTIAVQYALFRPADNTCCPSGGSATVRYRWTGDHLEPLDSIPTNLPNAPLSRR